MGSSNINEINLGRPQTSIDKKPECTFYQNEGMNEYICQLRVNIPNSTPPEFIFIIDKSGSMGFTYNYIISNTIPEVLNSLGYKDRTIHLITFDDDVHYLTVSQSELRTINCKSGGCTHMSKSYEYLEEIFCYLKGQCNNLRILAISDGKLHDQEETKQKGDLLYKKYKNVFNINSQSIRLYTGSEQPDSSGIMSFLKFNNVKACQLVNHSHKTINNLANVIINLFENDGLIETDFKIIGDGVKLKIYPWEEASSNILPFKNGKYTIFCDKNKPLYIGKENNLIPLKMEIGEKISNYNFESIVGEKKLNNIFQLFRFNKTLNTNGSKEENKIIINYFENLCKNTIKINNDRTLEFFIEKFNHLSENNDNEINKLDEDKKALYVKEIDEKKAINKYKKDYDEKSFWNTIKKYGRKIGAKPLYATFILYNALPKVSILDKGIIIGALGYLISPFDIIPDVIPVIGLTDDIGVLMWAVYRITSNSRNVDDEVKAKAKAKLKGIFDTLTDEEIEKLL